MKKINLLLVSLLIIFGLSACNNANKLDENSNDQDSSTEVTSNSNVVAEPLEISDHPTSITQEEFKAHVFDYTQDGNLQNFKGDLPVIIDFYADWCKPCLSLTPIFEDLQAEYEGEIRILKVNTDENSELASFLAISSIPAIMYVNANGEIETSVGANQEEYYRQMIEGFLLGNN